MASWIGSIHRYAGWAQGDLVGRRVVVAAVLPGGSESNALVGMDSLHAHDDVEVFALLDGTDLQALSNLAYSVAPDELEATGEYWRSELPFPRCIVFARGRPRSVAAI
jgi:hypothetical protein